MVSVMQENWSLITSRSVISTNGGTRCASSLKGRGICLIHTLATPLKAYSGLGRLVLATISTASDIFAVLTLNAHPKELVRAGKNILNITLGAALLPFVMLANIVRGVVGTIFHPGAMIREEDSFLQYRKPYLAKHNIIEGTLVNYPLAND